MKKHYSMGFCLLISMFIINSNAGFSTIKAPPNFRVTSYFVTGDYIWYSVYYADDLSHSGIVRLNIPSKKSLFFEDSDIDKDLLGFKDFFATDYSHSAVLDSNGNLYHYGGDKWRSYKGEEFKWLAPSSNGKIWVASEDSIGYLQNDSLTFISRNSLGIFDSSIVDMKSDDQQNVYLLNKKQVARYNGESWKVFNLNDSMAFSGMAVFHNTWPKVQFYTGSEKYTISNDTLETFTTYSTVINPAYWDEAGNLWMLNDSIFSMSHNDTHINILNANNYGWKNWPNILCSEAYSLSIDGKHVLLNYLNGFYYYSGGNNLEWEWIPLGMTVDNRSDMTMVTKIIPSCDSSVYLLKQSGEIINYKSGKFQILPYLSSRVKTVYQDRNGGLWAGTDEHLYTLNENIWAEVPISSTKFNVEQIIEDTQGTIIVTGDNILLKRSGRAWEIINHSNSNLPQTVSSKIIQSSDGEFWMKTNNQGIARSKDLYSWSCYNTTNSILENNIRDMIIDSKGIVYASVKGSLFNSIYKFDGNAWQIKRSPEQRCGILQESKDGIIWFNSDGGTDSSFLYYYNERAWLWYKADSMVVHNLQIDHLNQIWVTTDKGLGILNPEATAAILKRIVPATTQSLSVNSISQGSSVISYSIAQPADITLAVYNLQGKLVSVIKKGYLNKGIYNTVWKYSGARGMYIIKLSTPQSINYLSFRVL